MRTFQSIARYLVAIVRRPGAPFSSSRCISTTSSARDSQTLTLPDGRTLGYGEFGAPDGFPLLYFHGYPFSRLEGYGLDQVARQRRIRLLALDRPGFGLSTLQPGRTIAGWAADVRAFADDAALERFAVLGASGGGPYALACAAALPRERLSAVGVLAGAPPWAAGHGDLEIYRRVLAVWANTMPWTLRLVTDALVGVGRWITTTGPVTRRLDAWLESERQKEKAEAESGDEGCKPSIEDEETLPVAERRARFIRIIFDAFAQGSPAALQEMRLLSAPDWGFRLEDVHYEPVLIWHGTKDANSPISMIRWMAERLPHSDLRELEGESHYTIVTPERLGQYLSELVPPMKNSVQNERE